MPACHLSIKPHFSFERRFSNTFARPIDLTLGLVAPFPSIKNEGSMQSFFSIIENAAKGGITYVQLWGPNKDLESSEIIVKKIKNQLDQRNISLIINNCVNLAFKLHAAGVHVGQRDLSCLITRKLLGSQTTIGLTVNTWAHVIQAEDYDIDYIGVQVSPSITTKKPHPSDYPVWGIEGAKKVISYSRHRVVLIGNITLANLPVINSLLRPGDGVAIAGEIMRSNDPRKTSKEIFTLISKKN